MILAIKIELPHDITLMITDRTGLYSGLLALLLIIVMLNRGHLLSFHLPRNTYETNYEKNASPLKLT